MNKKHGLRHLHVRSCHCSFLEPIFFTIALQSSLMSPVLYIEEILPRVTRTTGSVLFDLYFSDVVQLYWGIQAPGVAGSISFAPRRARKQCSS